MSDISQGSVLFAVSEYGEFFSLVNIAQRIENELKLHPVFVFTPGYGKLKEHSQLTEVSSWSWAQIGTVKKSYKDLSDSNSSKSYFVNSPEGEEVNSKKITAFSFIAINFFRVSNIITRLLTRRNKPESSLARLSSLKQLKSLLKHSKKILSDTNAKLIISGQDYALSVTSILSNVAEEQGIKTAIIPFSMPPTTRELIESLSYSRVNKISHTQYKFIKHILNPAWFNKRRGEIYTRLDPLSAMLCDLAGISPPAPWLPNSGKGIIFTPSQWAYNYYLKSGIPESQLIITGAIWSDSLIKAKNTIEKRKQRLLNILKQRARLSRKLKLDEFLQNTSKIVLVSWPPNQFPRTALGCQDYEDLCNQFIISLSEIQNTGAAYVVVSLHPTITDPNILKNLSNAGIFVLRTSLLEYIDCVDVFVSTVSSTSFWALQSLVPTINFDGYMYGYTEFDEAGAITIHTPLEMLPLIEKLTKTPDFYKTTVECIKQKIPLFTEASTNNSKRIMENISKLLHKKQ